MKKFLALMLALVMVLSLAACGSKKDDTASDDSADAKVSESTDTTEASEAPAEESSSTTQYAANSLWTLLTPVTPPDISGTTWNFSGGYINGAEMTQEELDASLQQYGGTLQFVFGADGSTVTMVQGGGSVEGTVTVLADEEVGLTFPDRTPGKYACIFTKNSDGAYTLVAIADQDGMNGLYFTLAQ